MSDSRPHVSPMPAEAAAIGQSVVDRLKPMLDEAFDAIGRLPGNPAERQNDALSVLSNVAAFVGLQLTARIMQAKSVGPETAMGVVLGDFSDRMCAEFVSLMFGGKRG